MVSIQYKLADQINTVKRMKMHITNHSNGQLSFNQHISDDVLESKALQKNTGVYFSAASNGDRHAGNVIGCGKDLGLGNGPITASMGGLL